MPSTGVPSAFCRALVVSLPHFPSAVMFAFFLFFDDFLLFVPSCLFTSSRTFSYSFLLIPKDFLRASCPDACLPAITSSAIFEIDFPLFLLEFLPDDFPPIFFTKSSQDIPLSPDLRNCGQFFPLTSLCGITFFALMLCLPMSFRSEDQT